jgi:transposase-like protein
MASVLSEPYFQDEAAAFERLEAIVWPRGPVCPHCGCTGRIGILSGVKDKKGRVRPGLKKCYDCRKQFTVRVGTVFESSHVALHIWFQAAYLMCSSKKGVSSNQLHRTLGVTLQTAWFMSHRLREAMRPADLTPMGGAGNVVEADTTVFGKVEGAPKDASFKGSNFRNIVLTLVQRDGSARSWHIEGQTVGTMMPIIRANVDRETALMTDEWTAFKSIGTGFASHETVNHSQDEYVRGDVTTNTVEGYFSIFKRGMQGVYQHCGERHLHRYLSEFDFRYSNRIALGINDLARTERALGGIKGKRLTYRTPNLEEMISI